MSFLINLEGSSVWHRCEKRGNDPGGVLLIEILSKVRTLHSIDTHLRKDLIIPDYVLEDDITLGGKVSPNRTKAQSHKG